jgi:hypothetical protein
MRENGPLGETDPFDRSDMKERVQDQNREEDYMENYGIKDPAARKVEMGEVR